MQLTNIIDIIQMVTHPSLFTRLIKRCQHLSKIAQRNTDLGDAEGGLISLYIFWLDIEDCIIWKYH